MRPFTHIAAILALVLAVMLAVAPVSARAQPVDALPDYAAWEHVAAFAENAVTNNRASATAFEQLRNEIAAWRDEFRQAQKTNGNAIDTVQAQLDALGPVPESGSEAEDVAAKRLELNDRLSELQAPIKKAELAFSQADTLISGIDKVIHERQAEELLAARTLTADPGELDPGHQIRVRLCQAGPERDRARPGKPQ